MLRKAKQTDLPQILAMWRESFGDTDSGICSFFSAFPGCRSYVAELDGKAVSMVHALPQTLRLEQDCSAAYLYAVATAAPYRGRGLCRRLMAYAEAELRHGGFDCCVLTPGEPSLFRFYEDLGYKTAFTRKRTPWHGEGEPVSAAEYSVLRSQLLPPGHMAYDTATLEYAERVYGLRFYRTANGCAAAGEYYTAEVLPDDCEGMPFAMIKWLREPAPEFSGFLGFALE